MSTDRRLIEVAFPLKQTSLDSVHEKNVRHGHISTLHIWPARRPLAAARAALIATLLPDPGDEKERQELLRKIGGTVETSSSGKETTKGGVLHWKREKSPVMDEFREMIREAYGGRAPRVLDPFSGGGAIPLEAMRLGCDTTAIDINPVAWFILKCTLEYPQKLAGEKRPLPEFATEMPGFMDTFFKKKTNLSKKKRERRLDDVQQGSFAFADDTLFDQMPSVDLSWHVRAWGHWVLSEARKELADFYPTYAHFEDVTKDPKRHSDELRRVPTHEDGTIDLDALNAEFDEVYLANDENPRWVAKPTVAYLWTRTVACKKCRASIPLLKTTWLVKDNSRNRRVLLEIRPNADRSGVTYFINQQVPKQGKGAELRENDSRLDFGTMSGSGATCPCCTTTIMTMEDLRQAGRGNDLNSEMFAVVVHGQTGKEYRLPTDDELSAADRSERAVQDHFGELPYGQLDEPTPYPAGVKRNSSSLPLYGLYEWKDVYEHRQLLSLASLTKHSRRARRAMELEGYPEIWVEALASYTAVAIDRLADYNSAICNWDSNSEYITHTFQRYALPIKWDFSEVNPFSGSTGSFEGGIEWVARVVSHALDAAYGSANVLHRSAVAPLEDEYDLIITDPPYYSAIMYSDIMDFFYVWLRRNLHGLSAQHDIAFGGDLNPKWNHEEQDGELIDDPGRHDWNFEVSKKEYEDGMARAFASCYDGLTDDGRLCVVFANKSPDAWETLVSAIIRAGFVVDASWPIETEMINRPRAQSSAALSSSIWIVCKKRPKTARPGWDQQVLSEMRQNITDRLRQFWDAGITGPDFVWAATGPAMEAYSKHPVVKKADEPGQRMDVAEFLSHVRREVVDFAVGRVLSQNGHEDDTEGLDNVTAYYLLHRNDYAFEKAPVGACILYALSCGLSDSDLSNRYDLIEVSGSDAQLKTWKTRERPKKEKLNGTTPVIDQVHRLMHLWKAGDQRAVDGFVEEHGLGQHALFHKVMQALIELSMGEERTVLESVSNYLKGRRGDNGQRVQETQAGLF